MIKYSQIKRIHFVGIGGAGMSGIAEVLNNMGFQVSGSDIAENQTIKKLIRLGICIDIGHNANHVVNAETLVYSSAIKQDNVEITAARANNIPIISRAEMLAELMRLKFSIAVAGTHGKTTTTSMLATILTHAGKDPTYVVGGKLKTQESGAKLGKSDYLVAEADESDGSFLQLFPTIAVLTNIEDDHLDYYQSMNNLIKAFIDFGNKIPFYGMAIVNYECANIRAILPSLNKRVLTYGVSDEADIKAIHIQNHAFSLDFDLIVKGSHCGHFQMNIGGLHNLSNALAAIGASIQIGIEIDVIKQALSSFHLPQRRFQILYQTANSIIIDDYAHHPTEIKCTLKTLKQGTFKRVIAVFQPHRFTRLQILIDQFVPALTLADKLIIAELYSAQQTAIENVSSEFLVDKIIRSGYNQVQYQKSFDCISDILAAEFSPGDAIIFLSAGNLTDTAHKFAEMIADREDATK